MVSTEGGTERWEYPQTRSGKSPKMERKVLLGAQKGFFRLFVFLLDLFIITGSAQEIILQPSNSSNARCSDGSVVDGKAQIVMVGLVVADGTKPREFTFYKKRIGDSSPTSVCTVNADVEKCDGQLATPCYCQGKTGDTYRVVYNMTADKQDSNASLTLGYDGDRSSDQYLPIVHSVERIRVSIAGVGNNIPLSSVCSYTFSPGRAYAFTICAENLQGAEFYIGTDAVAGPWKTAINDCWPFSVTLQTSPLIFAYRETRACRRSGSEKCTLSSDSESEKDDDTGCDTGCIIGITIGAIAFVAVIVGIIFFIARK